MNINDYLIKNDLKLLSKESHPYNDNSLKEFLPNARVLIVGTFPPARFTEEGKKLGLELDSYDVEWFYGSEDNQFWKLIADICNVSNLDSKEQRQNFVKDKKDKKDKFAFLDLFQEIQRYRDYSSDNYILPTQIINLYKILEDHNEIKSVIFTSQWAEAIARREHREYYGKFIAQAKTAKEIEYFTITQKDVKCFLVPSPSPMASLKFDDKKERYSEVFKEVGIL